MTKRLSGFGFAHFEVSQPARIRTSPGMCYTCWASVSLGLEGTQDAPLPDKVPVITQLLPTLTPEHKCRVFSEVHGLLLPSGWDPVLPAPHPVQSGSGHMGNIPQHAMSGKEGWSLLWSLLLLRSESRPVLHEPENVKESREEKVVTHSTDRYFKGKENQYQKTLMLIRAVKFCILLTLQTPAHLI